MASSGATQAGGLPRSPQVRVRRMPAPPGKLGWDLKPDRIWRRGEYKRQCSGSYAYAAGLVYAGLRRRTTRRFPDCSGSEVMIGGLRGKTKAKPAPAQRIESSLRLRANAPAYGTLHVIIVSGSDLQVGDYRAVFSCLATHPPSPCRRRLPISPGKATRTSSSRWVI